MRQVAVGHEVGIEVEAQVRDGPDGLLLKELSRWAVDGILDVVEPDDRRHARPIGRIGHLAGQGGGVGERLFTIDVLAGDERGHRHLVMHLRPPVESKSKMDLPSVPEAVQRLTIEKREGVEAPWDFTIETALRLRRMLDDEGLETWPKLTEARGCT